MDKKNRKNLEKLATYLEGLPKDYEHFDMRVYQKRASAKAETDAGWKPERELQVHERIGRRKLSACGSAACAIGHGPSAGIRATKSDWSWSAYAERVFGHSECGTSEGVYMFGSSQEGDHRDAAKRIRRVLAGKPLS